MYSHFLVFVPVIVGLHKFNPETGELGLELKSLAVPLRPLFEPPPTVMSQTSSTAQVVVAKASTTGYEWSVGDWGRCDAECGKGIQKRKVECRHMDTKVLGDESICKTDFQMPDTTRDCEGDCLSCPTSHGELFRRSGLGSPADPANYEVDKLDEYTLCQVPTGAYATCCTASNEDAIRSEVSRLSKSLDDMMLAVPTLLNIVNSGLQTFTTTLTIRKAETEAALTEVNAAMTNGSSDPTRTLPVLKEVLQSRVAYFQTSSAAVEKAANFLKQQIDSFTDSGNNIGTTCGRAAMKLFAEMSCASCNVDFPDRFVVDSTIRVSEFDCNVMHKACRSSISEGHGKLLNALRELSRVHADLRKQSLRVQPALARVWSNLRFDWIPGSLPTDINKNPDLTQLQCIRQSVIFDLPQISRSNDFCSMYVSPFEADTFAGRLRQTLLQGKTTMEDLLTCDGCVHAVLTRLPALIVQAAESASLEVRFPTEEAHVCLMANRVPKSVSLINTMRSQLTGNGPYTDITKSSFVQQLDTVPTAALKPNAPVPVKFVKDGGADVGVIGNITSWDALVSVGTLLPPRPIWEPETSGVGIQVWDKSCTKHEECYDQGGAAGDAAWWFCAAPVACKQSGTCSPSDEELLNKGAKCAKGPCVDGTQAVDEVCPEVAVCPAEAAGTLFGPKYFSKLQLVHEDDGEPGVCACAFAPTTDANSFTVADKCKQAACMAYAQSFEDNAACKLKLFDTCEILKAGGCDVVCTPEAIAWTPPVCAYTLSSESVIDTSALASSSTMASSVLAVVALVSSSLLLLM